MRYDELISLERKAIFQYSSINETNAVFSSRIWEQSVPLPEKIDLRDFGFHFVKLPDGMLLPRENR